MPKWCKEIQSEREVLVDVKTVYSQVITQTIKIAHDMVLTHQAHLKINRPLKILQMMLKVMTRKMKMKLMSNEAVTNDIDDTEANESDDEEDLQSTVDCGYRL